MLRDIRCRNRILILRERGIEVKVLSDTWCRTRFLTLHKWSHEQRHYMASGIKKLFSTLMSGDTSHNNTVKNLREWSLEVKTLHDTWRRNILVAHREQQDPQKPVRSFHKPYLTSDKVKSVSVDQINKLNCMSPLPTKYSLSLSCRRGGKRKSLPTKHCYLKILVLSGYWKVKLNKDHIPGDITHNNSIDASLSLGFNSYKSQYIGSACQSLIYTKWIDGSVISYAAALALQRWKVELRKAPKISMDVNPVVALVVLVIVQIYIFSIYSLLF
jgi:hypothetical protein